MTDDSSWLDSMPAAYDARLGPVLFAPFGVHLAQLAAKLAPNSVLELAAGTGIATAQLVQALPAADIVATDLNPAMVAWGAERVPGASWRQADAQVLDFADDAFDLVVCQFGVMFFPDRPAAYAEAARVLRPGGTLLFTTWDDVERSQLPAALVECLVQTFPHNCPDFVVRVPHGYADPSQIRADLESAGLQVQSIEPTVLHGQAESARSATEGFCRGTPLRFALEARGDLDALTAEIADAMAARLGPGPVDTDLAAYVVTATNHA